MLTRRTFLHAIGIGAAAIAAPALIAEPVRRIWQVSRNAPVGLRDAYWAGALGGGLKALYFHDIQRSNRTLNDLMCKGLIRGEPIPQTHAGRMQLAEDMVREGLLGSPEVRQILVRGKLDEPIPAHVLGSPYLSPEQVAELKSGTSWDHAVKLMRAHHVEMDRIYCDAWDIEPIQRALDTVISDYARNMERAT